MRRAALSLFAILLSGSSAWPQTPIKIGVLNDRSGAYADITGEGSVVAAQMAVEDFGKSNTLRASVIAADHQNKPDIGSDIARRWYDQEGVDVIVDVPTSSIALAVSDITRQRNKVFLVSGGGTTELTGRRCSPNTVHWTYDTYALANGTALTLVNRGQKSWFFVTADYTFGHVLEKDATSLIEKAGGHVVGSVKAPFPTNDFSSFLIQAKSSRANVIGLANAGADSINAIKQAHEFNITKEGQILAALLMSVRDVKALGLDTAQGLVLTEPFYWDLNDGTRNWSKRFAERMGKGMPTSGQAGVYSAVLHYLKAVSALNEDDRHDGVKVVNKMKEMETDDPIFGKGAIRKDGRKIHPIYVFDVKSPAESKGEWDLYNLSATIPAERAFRPLEEGECPLVR